MSRRGSKVQCRSCPWKVGTDPDRDIPGYSRDLHHSLSCTVAEPGAVGLGLTAEAPIRMMACHYSHKGPGSRPCVGWAVNQLGPGNNLPLRMLAMRDERLQGLRVVGPQHEHFEDALPGGCR